mgnify:CR=1 FL=1
MAVKLLRVCFPVFYYYIGRGVQIKLLCEGARHILNIDVPVIATDDADESATVAVIELMGCHFNL